MVISFVVIRVEVGTGSKENGEKYGLLSSWCQMEVHGLICNKGDGDFIGKLRSQQRRTLKINTKKLNFRR